MRVMVTCHDAPVLSACRLPQGFTCSLEGFIASAAFASGHRFVVGLWHVSPLGPMGDVMWARPGGERTLLVGTRDVGELITAVYRFDRVEQVPLDWAWDGSTLCLRAGALELVMRAGRGWRIPFARLRSLPVVRWLEAPVAARLLGVRTFGTSPTGVFEWYRADRYQPVLEARASLDGADLGRLSRFEQPTGFGFSDPPRRSSVVRVRPVLVDTTESELKRLRNVLPSVLRQICSTAGRSGST